MQTARYYAHGKLLLTAEYVVLHGATALAVPTRAGQWLELHPNDGQDLWWQAWDAAGQKWFEAHFRLPDLHCSRSTDAVVANKLSQMLQAALALQPSMREVLQGLLVQTKLEFDRHWGLGSSSTLVSLLSQWFDIPPYDLFNRTQTGSGYDLACATAKGPIFYQLQQGQATITPVRFQPNFQSQLYFAYLGQKQFSDREVKAYLGHGKPDAALLQEVSDLTRSMVDASSLDEFAGLLEAHEALLSAELRRPTVQQQLFATYPGQVKSLGAWGGDFVLATAPDPAEALAWLQNNAFKTVVPYDQMI